MQQIFWIILQHFFQRKWGTDRQKSANNFPFLNVKYEEMWFSVFVRIVLVADKVLVIVFCKFNNVSKALLFLDEFSDELVMRVFVSWGF